MHAYVLAYFAWTARSSTTAYGHEQHGAFLCNDLIAYGEKLQIVILSHGVVVVILLIFWQVSCVNEAILYVRIMIESCIPRKFAFGGIDFIDRNGGHDAVSVSKMMTSKPLQRFFTDSEEERRRSFRKAPLNIVWMKFIELDSCLVGSVRYQEQEGTNKGVPGMVKLFVVMSYSRLVIGPTMTI